MKSSQKKCKKHLFRTAFTMIELVFVIVILGVLAAVAIPKLAATRADANVAKIGQNIMTGAAEIASYATAKGRTETDLTIMSNAINELSNANEAVLSSNKAVIEIGGVPDCVTLEIQRDLTDDNLTISLGSPGNDSECLHLQNSVDAARYPMKLRGQYIVY